MWCLYLLQKYLEKKDYFPLRIPSYRFLTMVHPHKNTWQSLASIFYRKDLSSVFSLKDSL